MYGQTAGCVPGKPGCLQVRSASVPTFFMGSSLSESWTKSRKQVLSQLGDDEGLNGAMAEWPQQMAVVSSERLYRMRVRTDKAFDASDRQRPVWEVPRDASPTLPAEPPYTRSVRTVAREGASAMGLPIPMGSFFKHFI